MAINITGIIIRIIITDMYHHWGPRVVFIDAIIIGSVWVSVSEINNERRYSFQQSINTSIKVAESPGLASGSTIVVKILYREAPSNAAFSSRSIGMLKKKSLISQTTIGMLMAT